MKVGILIALAIMFLLMALLFLPLGIRLHFTDSGTLTQLKIGPFHKTVDTNAPRKPKKKKTREKRKNYFSKIMMMFFFFLCFKLKRKNGKIKTA